MQDCGPHGLVVQDCGHTVYYKWRGMGPRADRGAHGPLGHTAYWANGLHIEVDRGGPRGPDVGLQDDMQDKVRSPPTSRCTKIRQQDWNTNTSQVTQPLTSSRDLSTLVTRQIYPLSTLVPAFRRDRLSNNMQAVQGPWTNTRPAIPHQVGPRRSTSLAPPVLSFSDVCQMKNRRAVNAADAKQRARANRAQI